ncbi:cylicin-1-like [Sitophilus oryzae]|uniref:Cylicin-1-like n=1 Tax=Sitophilus oryzae TaxID=7048 RepID=A0A6J2YQV9_SITOR|nr:cylicin-1-like [Sitophilus oryzae]
MAKVLKRLFLGIALVNICTAFPLENGGNAPQGGKQKLNNGISENYENKSYTQDTKTEILLLDTPDRNTPKIEYSLNSPENIRDKRSSLTEDISDEYLERDGKKRKKDNSEESSPSEEDSSENKLKHKKDKRKPDKDTDQECSEDKPPKFSFRESRGKHKNKNKPPKGNQPCGDEEIDEGDFEERPTSNKKPSKDRNKYKPTKEEFDDNVENLPENDENVKVEFKEKHENAQSKFEKIEMGQPAPRKRRARSVLEPESTVDPNQPSIHQDPLPSSIVEISSEEPILYVTPQNEE